MGNEVKYLLRLLTNRRRNVELNRASAHHSAPLKTFKKCPWHSNNVHFIGWCARTTCINMQHFSYLKKYFHNLFTNRLLHYLIIKKAKNNPLKVSYMILLALTRSLAENPVHSETEIIMFPSPHSYAGRMTKGLS